MAVSGYSSELAATAGTCEGEIITRENGNIPDEFASKIDNAPGTLSMANTGTPNSGGSQFFMNTAHNSFLNWWDSSQGPAKHPVFGQIREGYDVAKRIGEVPTNGHDDPIDPIEIKRGTIDPMTMDSYKQFL